MTPRTIVIGAGVLLGVLIGVAGCTSTDPGSAVPPSPSSRSGGQPPAVPTGIGTPAASGVVTKVLVFVMENHSLAQMRSQMPYSAALADRFGYATRYRGIGHPSLPNYIAIASGQTHGITDDGDPAVNTITGGKSIFGQAIAAGKTAGVFAEGMTNNCASTSGGNGYAVKHNPWVYFAAEQELCQKFDVPIQKLAGAIAGGRLPTVGMVVPNLCNDAHDCPLSTADSWFAGWMTRIFAGPDWTSGRLAVILTADENDNSAGNTVLTVVIHPSQHGNVVSTPLTHYSLTRLYADVSGVIRPSRADTAPSMSLAFGLPLAGLP